MSRFDLEHERCARRLAELEREALRTFAAVAFFCLAVAALIARGPW